MVTHAGTGNMMGYVGQRGGGINGGYVELQLAGAAKVAIDSNGISYFNGGNIGIGTMNPLALLDVTGTVRLNGPKSDTLSNFASFADITSKTLLSAGSAYWALREGVTDAGSLHFDIYNSGSPKSALSILQSGNIGVGTTTPAQRLHVVGNLRVDGNISALYQDVAEWVESNEAIASATVVIADADEINRVKISPGVAYDTAVAGVVSAQPGVLLGEEKPGKVAVAQSGRVLVKVDASYGAIRAGDLLVTSPVPGYAMRSQPVMLGDVPIHRPGTILGKALQPLVSGRGEILVLLTLQ